MDEEDEVARVFAEMHAEMNGVLAKHETEMRRVMLAAPKQHLPEHRSTGQAEEHTQVPAILPIMHVSKWSSDTGEVARPGTSSQKLNWTNQLNKQQGASPVKQVLQQIDLQSAKATMSGKLPSLVSEESMVAKILKSTSWTLMRSAVMALDAMLVVFDAAQACMTARDTKWKGPVPDLTFSIVLADWFFAFCFLDFLCQFIIEFPVIDLVKGRTGYRWFNIVVLVEQFLQVVSQHAQPNKRLLSTFRIVVTQLSILRFLRACIVLPELAAKLQLGVQELRVMIRSLMGAFQPLLWCSTPFLLLLTTFAVFVSEGALVWLLKHDVDSDAHVKVVESFGTFDRTMLSLYKALLGGMDWGDLYAVMSPLATYLRIAFLCFICFNFIAMLNIVAAVFIKVAFIRSESDKQFLIQVEMQQKLGYLGTMSDVFNQLDEDGDGLIKLEELERHLSEPGVGAYFTKMGVDVTEVGKLFTLLDEDNSGSIDREEFMYGCLRLKGEAKSLDLAILQRELDCLRQELSARHELAMQLQPGSGCNHPQTSGPAMFKTLREDVRSISNSIQDLRSRLGDSSHTV